MTSRILHMSVDCADPYRLASFWGDVLGRPVSDQDAPGDDEAAVELDGDELLLFQRVPEPKAAKNRLHLCLRPDTSREAEAARLQDRGATLVADRRTADGNGWFVLADPEGNEFCVLRGTDGEQA